MDKPAYWSVTDLVAVKRPEGHTFDLWVEMSGPGGVARFPVQPDALLCYAEFQRVALRRVGAIYRHVGCEGRSVEAADEAWRVFTSVIRYGPIEPASAPPPGVAEGPAN